jgi:hypothetical protein
MNTKAIRVFLSASALILACASAPAAAQIRIGINLQLYPQLVQVPGYPVYYAPQMNSNYFFYDGMYWVYQDDNWYASSWYNGPWGAVDPQFVPLYILRVPVGYYRQPPLYFRGWQAEAPPRWGDHWGNDWAQRRRGWDHWDRGAVPPPAPLPRYQQQYSGDRYPRPEQQQALQNQQYHYQPREPLPHDAFVSQKVQSRPLQGAPAAAPQVGDRHGSDRQGAPDHVQGASPAIQRRAPEEHREQAQPRRDVSVSQKAQKGPSARREHAAPQPQAKREAPREAQGHPPEPKQRQENDPKPEQGSDEHGHDHHN